MNQTAVNFAKALYTLAEEEGLQTPVMEQLQVIRQAFAQQEPCFRPEEPHVICPGLIHFFTDPAHPPQHNIGGKDESFREPFRQRHSKTPFTATQIQFHKPVIGQVAKITEQGILIGQNVNFFRIGQCFLKILHNKDEKSILVCYITLLTL